MAQPDVMPPIDMRTITVALSESKDTEGRPLPEITPEMKQFAMRKGFSGELSFTYQDDGLGTYPLFRVGDTKMNSTNFGIDYIQNPERALQKAWENFEDALQIAGDIKDQVTQAATGVLGER